MNSEVKNRLDVLAQNNGMFRHGFIIHLLEKACGME
jgi:hypothetical protein